MAIGTFSAQHSMAEWSSRPRRPREAYLAVMRAAEPTGPCASTRSRRPRRGRTSRGGRQGRCSCTAAGLVDSCRSHYFKSPPRSTDPAMTTSPGEVQHLCGGGEAPRHEVCESRGRIERDALPRARSIVSRAISTSCSRAARVERYASVRVTSTRATRRRRPQTARNSEEKFAPPIARPPSTTASGNGRVE